MKKYKAFLTMEFEADVETENEDEAREMLASRIKNCGCHSWGRIQNAKVKRYWGGGKEMVQNEQK